MENSQNIIYTETFETKKRHQKRKIQIEEKSNKISERYKYDINNFISFCKDTGQPEDVNSMLDFLYVSLTVHQVKKNTWERRLASVKKYLSVVHGVDFIKETEVSKELSVMRKMYDEEQYKDLIHVKGKTAVN